jgi:hypothetical protein
VAAPVLAPLHATFACEETDVESEFILNEAVLLLDTALLPPETYAIDVIVTVVEPGFESKPEGTVKVPLLAPIISVAVLPLELFAPFRL